MAEEKANRLEQQFHSLPGIVQSVLQDPYKWMDNALRSVTGKPDELLAVIPAYLQLADRVAALADEQESNRMALDGHWSGEAYQAFNDKLGSIEDQIRKLAGNIRQVQQLLLSGADACTEGADAIVDIVEMIISIALGTLIVNAALSVITFGASLAAEVADVVAEAAIAVARTAQVVDRVAQILMKIAEIFQKIAEVLKTIEELLAVLKEAMAATKALGKGAGFGVWATSKGAFAAEKFVATQTVNALTLGHFHPPGTASNAIHGARDGYAALDDANIAVHSVDSTNEE
jgi:uncharacterized protein YukE